MKICSAFVILVVLCLGEVKSLDVECTNLEFDNLCWNTESKEFEYCWICIIEAVEILAGNETISVSPNLKNGTDVDIEQVWFIEANITQIPVTQIKNKIGKIHHFFVVNSSTKVVNAKFLENVAHDLRFFGIFDEFLIIEENLFADSKQLEILAMVSCNISEIPSRAFAELQHLNHLNLKLNNLTNIDKTWFTDLQNLKKLDISGNEIELLKAGDFDNLTNLEILRLAKNYIEIIPKDLFKYNLKLTEIDFHDNKIKKIGNGVFEALMSVVSLDLGNNNCVNQWFTYATSSDIEDDLAKCYS